MKIIGLDISRGNATICPLETLPRDFKRYRKGVEKVPLSREGIKSILNIAPYGAVIEPTGGHYSKLWAMRLSEAGVIVKWVEHTAVDAYRKAHRCSNKSDLHDAVALACYGLEHWDNNEYFIRPPDSKIKDFYLQISHLNTVSTPLKNRLKQQLHHEWPEVAGMDLKRPEGQGLPLALRHIAGRKSTPKWINSEAQTIGTGISFFSKILAEQICAIEDYQTQLRVQMQKELQTPAYEPYIRAMERCGIEALSLSASLICAIYPFERFLNQGKVRIEYITTSNGKRTRRDRSRAGFKLACGLGMVFFQSGDKQGYRPGGSMQARTSLYLWIRMRVVMQSGKTDYNEPNKFVRDMQAYYKQTTGPGNLRIQKVARRIVDRLYKEMVAEFTE